MDEQIVSPARSPASAEVMDKPAGQVGAATIAELPILVVDDDADWASECAFSLLAIGCRPFVARNSQEALLLARRHEVTIAIIDYRLPDEDGLSLIEKLAEQAEEDGRQLGLIMATGYASLDLAVAALRVSVADFLQKPISPNQLREAIMRIYGLRQSRKAREDLVNRLSHLSGDLQRLASLITPDRPSDSKGGLRPEDITPTLVRKHIKSEARRRELAGGELFGDPSWSMLLDLLLARMEGTMLSVSSACIGSGAPMSTAMRLVRRFVDAGIVHKIPDEKDRRRDFLVLDDEMKELMLEYLAESMVVR
jgi:FixJ family two-component response regulator